MPEALEALTDEEAGKLIDMERLTKDAIRRAEQAGIIFIDEIDKVAGREGGGRGPDVSREGVQRDLLPIVEGSTVSTKYGPLKTDHVLFIAAGAFHVSKPKDLIPELQGRFPIRVELESLTDDDFVRILTEPENALTKQYTALLATEKVTARHPARRGRRDRAHRDAGERAHGEHRRAPPAHDHGAGARRSGLRGARARPAPPSPSPRPTSASASTASSRTRICRSTSCRREGASGARRGLAPPSRAPPGAEGGRAG